MATSANPAAHSNNADNLEMELAAFDDQHPAFKMMAFWSQMGYFAKQEVNHA